MPRLSPMSQSRQRGSKTPTRRMSNGSLSSQTNSKNGTQRQPSVNKTLTQLRSMAENRSCADCRSALVDPSNVYASFCISDAYADPETLERNPSHNGIRKIVGISLHDFQFTHRAFAPPDCSEVNDDSTGGSLECNKPPSKMRSRNNHDDDHDGDIAYHANRRFGGHGVFICSKCAEAHRQLGEHITQVLPVKDLSVWTAEYAEFMKRSGGNARCWRVYEAYVSETWKQKRPISSSPLPERLLFCRAKYEALAFCLPPPGPLAEEAWESVLEHNPLGQRYRNSADLRSIINLSTCKTLTGKDNTTKEGKPKNALPNRLVDHFCVVSSSMQILPKQVKKDLSRLTSPEQLEFWPCVSDCYPDRDEHGDMEFPEHLPSFVMAKGCHPTQQPQPPSFFSFVLTMGDGVRLYGGALQIYDDHYDFDDLRQALEHSNYEGELPGFLDDGESYEELSSDEVVYLPKCLVIISHHAFFDLFRSVLLELYQISLTAAPLPIERYISNFASEIPLPPQGRVRVEFGFTTERKFSIERPPVNALPMANFSYRPVFASLSVSNIIVVLTSLLEERKVVLLSHHASMLTPVAEALLSAMFPFQWVGLYIPMVPLSMLDILDAPVPYLVGIDSDYFQCVSIRHRPKDALLVDLDRDVIYMQDLQIPKPPSRDADKLLTSLEEAGGKAYLVPNSGIKGCIMAGSEMTTLVPNEERPRYAYMTAMEALDADYLGRDDVFSTTDLAYGGYDGHPKTISGFGTEHGQMTSTDVQSPTKTKKHGALLGIKPMKKPKFMRNKKADILLNSNAALQQGHLLDFNGHNEDGSFENIRKAFLRFTVATFCDYEEFLLPGGQRRLFDEKKIMSDLGFDVGSLQFLNNVVQTQLFQHFLEERKENPETPEIRYFDEAIIAKLNRSKKATMANGGKRPTPFLNDTTWRITKTFTPPPPSNLGLPDGEDTYTYGTFPSLNPSLYGRIRCPTLWRQHYTREATRFKYAKKNSKVTKAEREIMKKALKPIMSAPNALMAAASRSAKDLDSALAAVSIAAGLRERKSELSQSEKWRKEIVQKRSVNTLSKADMIMMNARRKNIILLDCITKIQAICRGYMSRRLYNEFKNTEVARSKTARIQEQVNIEMARRRFAEQNKRVCNANATVIQSIARMFLAQRMKSNSLDAIVKIQTCYRGSIKQATFVCMRHSAVVIQKNIKSQRTRMIFLELRGLVSRLEARIRGMQVRARMHFVLKEKMVLYRAQIFVLWTHVHLPLTVRTKLWPDLSANCSFLRLRLAESELQRLWGMAGFTEHMNVFKLSDEVTLICESLGLGNSVYRQCKKCIDWMNTTAFQHSKSPAVSDALKGEEVERLQIYERLITTSDKKLSKIYHQFDIPPDEKMKKVALSTKIWTNLGQAKDSVDTMSFLFPELTDSLGIKFQTPSAKGQRRFPNASKVPAPTLNQNQWNQISVEGNVKKHVQEVALLYITRVPSIARKLNQTNQIGFPPRYQQAIKHVHGVETWREGRHLVIVKYLEGRHSERSSNNVEVVLSGVQKGSVIVGFSTQSCDAIESSAERGSVLGSALFPDFVLHSDEKKLDEESTISFPDKKLR